MRAALLAFAMLGCGGGTPAPALAPTRATAEPATPVETPTPVEPDAPTEPVAQVEAAPVPATPQSLLAHLWGMGERAEVRYTIRAAETEHGLLAQVCDGLDTVYCVHEDPVPVEIDGRAFRFGEGEHAVELELDADGRTLRTTRFPTPAHGGPATDFRWIDQLEIALSSQLADMAHDADGDAGYDDSDYAWVKLVYDSMREGIERAGGDIYAIDLQRVFELEEAAGTALPARRPESCQPLSPETCREVLEPAAVAVARALSNE